MIYHLLEGWTRKLLLPKSNYDNMSIRENRIVVWSTSSDGFTPISTWDSSSKALKHFRSQRSYQDFTVVRHADETVLLSGVQTLRTSQSMITKHYDYDGILQSSQNTPFTQCTMHETWRPSNECSKILLSNTIVESMTFAHYRFSETRQTIKNVNFEYNAATRTLTSSTRRSVLPGDSENSESKPRSYRLSGLTIHSKDVFSIAGKDCLLPTYTDQRSHYVDDLHDFYCWQGAKTFTAATSDFEKINWDIRGRDEAHRLRDDEYGDAVCICFGDETFLVKCYQKVVEFYCFDKDLPSPGECPLYRQERERRVTARSEWRQHRAKTIAQS